MKNDIYKGYIASRSIRGLSIPQRIQNLVIRTYAEKNNKRFGLSATEYIMDNCYMMLDALVKEADQYNAIALYSLHMLPSSKSRRMKIYLDCLNKGAEMHFAFEELSIKKETDIDLIEDIILGKDLCNLAMNPQELQE